MWLQCDAGLTGFLCVVAVEEALVCANRYQPEVLQRFRCRGGKLHFYTSLLNLPSAGLKQTAPLPKPGSAQGFFLVVREFFLATVALGLL